jgi:hypothetical protein
MTRSVKPVESIPKGWLRPNVPARLLDRASRRARHVGDQQVFDADHVVPAGDLCTGLLDPVFAPILFGACSRANRALAFARRFEPRLHRDSARTDATLIDNGPGA